MLPRIEVADWRPGPPRRRLPSPSPHRPGRREAARAVPLQSRRCRARTGEMGRARCPIEPWAGGGSGHQGRRERRQRRGERDHRRPPRFEIRRGCRAFPPPAALAPARLGLDDRLLQRRQRDEPQHCGWRFGRIAAETAKQARPIKMDYHGRQALPKPVAQSSLIAASALSSAEAIRSNARSSAKAEEINISAKIGDC